MADRTPTELVEQLKHWADIWDGEEFDLDNFDPEILLDAANILKNLIQEVRDKDNALSFQLTDHG